jgi:hypothetical protein
MKDDLGVERFRIDLTLDESRALTGPALRAFFNIAMRLGLGEAELAAILGNPSPATLHLWQANEANAVDGPTLIRISYVLGIYKALNTLFSSPEQADSWMLSPNRASLFKGRSAIELLSKGRLSDLRAVRRYLDAQIVC